MKPSSHLSHIFTSMLGHRCEAMIVKYLPWEHRQYLSVRCYPTPDQYPVISCDVPVHPDWLEQEPDEFCMWVKPLVDAFRKRLVKDGYATA